MAKVLGLVEHGGGTRPIMDMMWFDFCPPTDCQFVDVIVSYGTALDETPLTLINFVGLTFLCPLSKIQMLHQGDGAKEVQNLIQARPTMIF